MRMKKEKAFWEKEDFVPLCMDIIRYSLIMSSIAIFVLLFHTSQMTLRPLNEAVSYNTVFFLNSLDYYAEYIPQGPYEGNDPIIKTICQSQGYYNECKDEICTFEQVIINECNGYVGYLAIIGLVFAYPRISWKERFRGIVIGMAFVYWMNVMRLISMAMAMNDISCWLFDFVHIFIWREGMIVGTLLIWAVWMMTLKEAPKRSKRKK